MAAAASVSTHILPSTLASRLHDVDLPLWKSTLGSNSLTKMKEATNSLLQATTDIQHTCLNMSISPLRTKLLHVQLCCEDILPDLMTEPGAGPQEIIIKSLQSKFHTLTISINDFWNASRDRSVFSLKIGLKGGTRHKSVAKTICCLSEAIDYARSNQTTFECIAKSLCEFPHFSELCSNPTFISRLSIMAWLVGEHHTPETLPEHLLNEVVKADLVAAKELFCKLNRPSQVLAAILDDNNVKSLLSDEVLCFNRLKASFIVLDEDIISDISMKMCVKFPMVLSKLKSADQVEKAKNIAQAWIEAEKFSEAEYYLDHVEHESLYPLRMRVFQALLGQRSPSASITAALKRPEPENYSLLQSANASIPPEARTAAKEAARKENRPEEVFTLILGELGEKDQDLLVLAQELTDPSQHALFMKVVRKMSFEFKKDIQKHDPKVAEILNRYTRVDTRIAGLLHIVNDTVQLLSGMSARDLKTRYIVSEHLATCGNLFAQTLLPT